jgi:hypothetical protein
MVALLHELGPELEHLEKLVRSWKVKQTLERLRNSVGKALVGTIVGNLIGRDELEVLREDGGGRLSAGHSEDKTEGK